jgi:nucleoside-diphosphate-sugar epimerase
VNWSGTTTLATGAASNIGSHLVEALLERGAEVRVQDPAEVAERLELALTER